MNLEISELGSTHVVNIMSQEDEEHKSNVASSTPGTTMPVSEPGSTDDDPNTRITNACTSVLPKRRQEKRACLELINGTQEDYIEICVPLYEAAITSDWEAVRAVLDKRPELVRYAITDGGDTILHIAVSAEDIIMAEKFVDNLLNRMNSEDLEIQNFPGDTAFMIAVAKGSIYMFELMLNKPKDLLNISPVLTLGALSSSTGYGNHEMALYLYCFLEKMCYVFWTDTARCIFLLGCLDGDMFVFASLQMKNRFPEKDNEAVNLLIYILKFYPRINKPGIIDDMVSNFSKEMSLTMELPEIVRIAAETGNTRFVIETIKIYPNMAWAVDNNNRSMFHIAVMHRHEGKYNLLYELGSKKGGVLVMTDKMKNTMLHLVGMTSNKMQHLQTVSGASLLMQRELLWFKEVERMIPPHMRYSTNSDGKTAYELFSENNQELISKGLKWTKDCMVVTTLIITVAFAAAFTVPGGYDQETGIPIFSPETSFLVFMIADGISLFSSSTSLLVFLSILTSHHGQRDFLYSLPKKLMIGLVTLFISVAAMMVTFAASFFVLYRNTHKWLPVLISILAATPVIIFAALQYPLLMDMFRSMYDSRYLFNPRRQVLYKRKKD